MRPCRFAAQTHIAAYSTKNPKELQRTSKDFNDFQQRFCRLPRRGTRGSVSGRTVSIVYNEQKAISSSGRSLKRALIRYNYWYTFRLLSLSFHVYVPGARKADARFHPHRWLPPPSSAGKNSARDGVFRHGRAQEYAGCFYSLPSWTGSSGIRGSPATGQLSGVQVSRRICRRAAPFAFRS